MPLKSWAIKDISIVKLKEWKEGDTIDVIDKITYIVKELDELDEYKNSLSEAQSNVDCKLSDLLHYIENNNLNAPQSCKIVKEIKKQREMRRQVKQDIELFRIYNLNVNKLTNEGNRKLLLAEINKANKKLQTTYHNRVYTEEELKELLGVK